jgi:hypothetical protein
MGRIFKSAGHFIDKIDIKTWNFPKMRDYTENSIIEYMQKTSSIKQLIFVNIFQHKTFSLLL